MSVMMCEVCDEFIDTDWEEMIEEKEGRTVCQDCYEALIKEEIEILKRQKCECVSKSFDYPGHLCDRCDRLHEIKSMGFDLGE